MRTHNGRGLLIGVVVAAGCVVVLGAMAAGPVRVGAPLWNPTITRPTPITYPGATSQGLPDSTAGNPVIASVIGLILQIVFFAALAALAAAVVVAIIRRIRQRRRLLRRRAGAGDVGGGTVRAADGDVPAPVVRRGLARALQILDEDPGSRDAVVQAWLGLEEAAADSGAGRTPAETPAEYTARIIQRFETDRSAAQELLRLYQDVRFGARTADGARIAAARTCLMRLQASWHTTDGALR